MLKIDTETMMIELTRSDSAWIVFSAVNSEGVPYEPTNNDVLVFSFAKKVGAEPIKQIENKFDENDPDPDVADKWWTIEIKPEHTAGMKFGDYAYDVQIEGRDDVTDELVGVATIIGKTDELSPTLRIWGEVSEESGEE